MPAPDGAQLGGEYKAPSTDVEIALADIWADLLGLKATHISAQSDFFQLGGHSLLVMRLVAEIRDRFAVELPLREVMERPQLNALADAVSRLALRSQVVVGSDYRATADEAVVLI